MKPCRSYQPQLALFALGELNEAERAGVLEHLGHCPGCQNYANQLQEVAGLYAQDAKRSVAIPTLTTRRRERPRIFSLPVASSPSAAPPLSIASSRKLAEKDLEELVPPDRSDTAAPRESLFYVRSRNGSDL